LGKLLRVLISDEENTHKIEVPRDRQATFEPKMVAKGQTRFDGFGQKILALYARGMTTRDIQAQLQEMYQVEVSPTLISNVTDAVWEEVQAWQGRALEPVYPIVYLDALYVKMRDNGQVENRAVYVAPAVNMEGAKEVLGMWTNASEGAKFLPGERKSWEPMAARLAPDNVRPDAPITPSSGGGCALER